MDIGLEWAGFQHRFFAEIDEYCRAVLAARFPGVHIYDDVRRVGEPTGRTEVDALFQATDDGRGEAGSRVPRRLDLLCGGFPCQDLSVAGKRAGLAGERSGLFFEFMRIVDALRPRAILIENVEGLYSSGSPKGADFGVVLDSLAERGYLASWRTLDAQHFGVPQRRKRVFVCAIADGDSGAERIGEVLAVSEGGDWDSPASDPAWPEPPSATRGGAQGGGGTGGDGSVTPERERESHPRRHRQVGEGQRRPSRGRVPEPCPQGRVVGALSARGYTKYTDQEFVRGGQLVTGDDLPIGINPSNTEIAGTLPSNQQVGQRTTDIAGAYVYRKSRRAQSVEDAETWVDDGLANTLNRFDTGDTRTTHTVVSSTVRRLTPMECERLMGWPDGWTDIPWNKKDHAPDSRRYAACGNGVVAPVSYWIGARLAEVLR